MGNVRIPRPVHYFASMLFTSGESLRHAFGELRYIIGEIREKTPSTVFSHTNYYDKEMGGGIFRHFVLFAPLLERSFLPEIKLKTIELERQFAVNGKRTINIDPGYITLENVVLATTKGYAHRIYLNKGIYADLTLVFQNGTFKPLEWTYPDYAGEEVIALLNGWREQYKRELK
jgi:hypothetical protein